MQVRILDLEGSLAEQRALQRVKPSLNAMPEWAPLIRMGCSFGRFRKFQRALAEHLQDLPTDQPQLTFYGSGDFHHVSLALVQRLNTPFNLLVLDNHPDWMRGLPFLHCGTWLWHAARLPLVRNVFHLGGDVDFDNGFQWLAPWHELHAEKIKVFPANRRFERGAWRTIPHEPLRPDAQTRVTPSRIAKLLRPHHAELTRWPLYISLDKDVMHADEAVVNWDSGRLVLTEVLDILQEIAKITEGNLCGMDIVGDWSPVEVWGWFRKVLHWTEHPELAIEPEKARRRNSRTNRALLRALACWWPSLCSAAGGPPREPVVNSGPGIDTMAG